MDQNPYCVLLLDEIEKAHPDLFNILLQVMDHGKLTDHNGKSVEFRNVVLIMTTTPEAAELAKPAIGFGSTVRIAEDNEAIIRMFTPEFRNRLDATVNLFIAARSGAQGGGEIRAPARSPIGRTPDQHRDLGRGR